ncbi:hypothetical protein KUV85_10035 [Nocardioides panacisoli]|uniref:HD domain-containing protein n=1 Tax=Nocardioides panacisoli TaxID=627624 RepID=UPI001C627AE2|nr:hypothetical protein [Nocardioides panacisoli]QYJ02678.1 hypothetical protein KUV85_10035 [Nocardioides panacisoli]
MADQPPPPWPLSDGEGLHEELLAAWRDEHRGYHDLAHLTAVLARLDELAAAGTAYDDLPVRLAAWFHDAVYDGERDAEERSAAWAEEALPGLVDEATVAEVARLVRVTEEHRPAEDDANGCALSDADLAILAAPREQYDAYVAAVRTEYADLPDEVFNRGRADVLRSLAEKPRLFHTAHATARWEAPARENLERELSGRTAATA